MIAYPLVIIFDKLMNIVKMKSCHGAIWDNKNTYVQNYLKSMLKYDFSHYAYDISIM